MDSHYEDYASGVDFNLIADQGVEHYRLLAWYASQFHNVPLIDIGTRSGLNAYALAYNAENTIYTFDTIDQVTHPSIKKRSNVHFQICDLFDEKQRQPWIKTLLETPLILLGIDPENELTGIAFYHTLKTIGYKGLLLCDNIWHSKRMKDFFWAQIPIDQRYDLTHVGHWTGTGLISFNAPTIINQQPIGTNNQDWTLVTAYFDLTKSEDTNQTVRPKSYYMDRARGTMACPYNLIVYCDATTLEDLQRMRPPHLMNRTQFIIVDFEELEISGHKFKQLRHQILDNRTTHRYHFDPRNNATYYLFCMSRYLLMERTLDENPFHSSHFAWINIHMEEMGYQNLKYLDEALSIHRDRFSTCYIDYIPKSLIDNIGEYFKMGRCSMCSGFFTGNHHYMTLFCRAISQQFIEYFEQGYGHADEQLYSPIYFKHPEWFEHYYGDYNSMITNYCWIREHSGKIMSNVIAHSFEHHDFPVCLRVCDSLLESYRHGHLKLSFDQMNQLLIQRELCHPQYRENSQKSPLLTQNDKHHSDIFKNIHESTIITLLYDLGNAVKFKDRLEKMDQWRQLNYPIIVWTDQRYQPLLQDLFKDHSRVHIKVASLEQCQTYQYRSKLSQLYRSYCVSNRNPEKDTEIYHLLVWSRYELWQRSIIENPFKTRTFICIDFGITRFTSSLKDLERWAVPDQVRMMLINPYTLTDPEPFDYFHITRHNVAGGLVSGSGEKLLEIIQLCNQELQLMLDQGWCQLDEAIMASVCRKNPQLIDYYYGDYCSIIKNYESIRDMTNISLIIRKYLDKKLYSEAQRVLNQIDYWSSPSALEIYVDYSILTNYYVFNKKLHPTILQLKDHLHSHEMVLKVMNRHQNNLKFYSNLTN